MPNDSSEALRTFPNDSEEFGSVPNDSEDFRKVRNGAERCENHTLTVREVARLFETAGVSRTERSITNWCQANKTGIARLDAYFDPNERKYFITPESVEAAIQEELAKEAKNRSGSDSLMPAADDDDSNSTHAPHSDESEVKTLEQKILDLTIMNKGKDYLIDELRKEREGFSAERERYVDQLMTFNRRVGELETKLQAIETSDVRQIG